MGRLGLSLPCMFPVSSLPVFYVESFLSDKASDSAPKAAHPGRESLESLALILHIPVGSLLQVM